jgi:hypothetical protein
MLIFMYILSNTKNYIIYVYSVLTNKFCYNILFNISKLLYFYEQKENSNYKFKD